MEQALLDFGLKDSLFAALFIFLLIHQMRTAQQREDKLYSFLDEMKIEFSKLVGSYQSLSKDVNEIRDELHEIKDKKGE